MSFIKKETSNIEIDGPVINVTILPDINTIHDFASRGEEVPQKRISALIDTGASCSCVDRQILDELKLVSRDESDVYTPSGKTKQALYDICISIPVNSDKLMNIQILGANLSGQPYGVLLGRDVLKKCTLIYNGWDNSYFLMATDN